jgi:hypothetical protein
MIKKCYELAIKLNNFLMAYLDNFSLKSLLSTSNLFEEYIRKYFSSHSLCKK